MSDASMEAVDGLFQSRHVLTHNLGVADEKFVAKTGQGRLLHRDVRIRREDLEFALGIVERIIRNVHEGVLQRPCEPPPQTQAQETK
jgi:hypothetical protein